MNRKFVTKISGGNIEMPFDLKKYLSTINDGTPVEITFGRVKNFRSTNQNRYYWGIVVKLISDHLGYFAEEVHEILRIKFLPESRLVNGENVMFARSTTSLKTDEFEDYLAKIRTWASVELSINIPEPNQVYWL